MARHGKWAGTTRSPRYVPGSFKALRRSTKCRADSASGDWRGKPHFWLFKLQSLQAFVLTSTRAKLARKTKRRGAMASQGILCITLSIDSSTPWEPVATPSTPFSTKTVTAYLGTVKCTVRCTHIRIYVLFHWGQHPHTPPLCRHSPGANPTRETRLPPLTARTLRASSAAVAFALITPTRREEDPVRSKARRQGHHSQS